MKEQKKKKQPKLSYGELEQKCKEYLNGWQRAQADYINLQKEAEKKRAEWIKLANAGLLMELLPIYDNLKLAIEHIPQDKKKSEWVVGIEHIKIWELRRLQRKKEINLMWKSMRPLKLIKRMGMWLEMY